MFSDVHKHVVEKIDHSSIVNYPYPHFTIDNIFPDDFYNILLQKTIPNNFLKVLKDSKRVSEKYSDARYFLGLKPNIPNLDNNIKSFYEDFAKWLHYFFKPMLLHKFNIPLKGVMSDALYVRDCKTYNLGPHTDSKRKVLTCLIYLPADFSQSQYGTSMYIPKDKNFTCPGGFHHCREKFILYKTIPFVPNKLFCFLKTDTSFHGVEPIIQDVERNLLIFDLQKHEV